MVRHSDVDRGRSDQCDGRRSGSLMARLSCGRVDLLRRLLAAARHRDHAGRPDHPNSSRESPRRFS